MKKIFFSLITFMIISTNALANVFIITDRNVTHNDIVFIKDLFDGSKLGQNEAMVQYITPHSDSIQFKKVKMVSQAFGFLNRGKKISIYKVLKALTNLPNLNPNDTIIILSNMYFKINIPDKHLVIDNSKQILNDGFLTSIYSPFRVLLDSIGSNNKLKNTKIMIVTNNNQPIFYMQKMRRFYFYLFQKLQANMFYFGNSDTENGFSDLRLDYMYLYRNRNKNFFTYSNLEQTNALQVISLKNKSITNIGLDLHVREDILY